ncbi:MAG: amidophosphoribosyltransferase [Eubacteriales bacterium]
MNSINEKPHEECGVFGVITPNAADVASIVYYGLYALQHRGQESCGIVVNDDGVFVSHKDLGLVGEVFTHSEIASLPHGNMAVGHVRYGTTGATTHSNCQPIEVNHLKGKLAVAHNGNLSNALALREELELSGAIFHSTSDTETIAYLITRQRLTASSIEEAVSRAMDRLEGAYSLVLMSAQKMIAVRDPMGFRPLCIGKTADGSYVAASESCALHAVGATFLRDVEPGEIVVFDVNGVHSIKDHCRTKQKKLCVFEYIYFARPDSCIDGVSVHGARRRAGEILANVHPADADVIIGVPDSGLDAALGYANASGIPYGIGLIKNKYIGRTFIAPEQNNRLDLVKMKLSPVYSEIRGKRIVLIDDSLVRGNTCRRLVAMLREAGAKEIHMRISSPPFLHPCYYGTDIDSEEHLIANHHTVDEICGIIGADSLGYLPISALSELAESNGFCAACFDGNYPTAIATDTRKDRFERKLSDVR